MCAICCVVQQHTEPASAWGTACTRVFQVMLASLIGAGTSVLQKCALLTPQRAVAPATKDCFVVCLAEHQYVVQESVS